MGRERDLLWRTGRSVGRTVYATYGADDPGERPDVLIGMMDTAELASEAVRSHNERLAAVRAALAGKEEG